VPLPIALLLLVVAQFADYATFVAMVGRHGLEAELNPLVVLVFERMGLLGVTIAKAAVVAFAAAVVTIIVHRRRTLGSLVAGFGVGSGLLGAFSNVLTI
jgi:hypothetical protein